MSWILQNKFALFKSAQKEGAMKQQFAKREKGGKMRK
jgi:hypothetical protein